MSLSPGAVGSATDEWGICRPRGTNIERGEGDDRTPNDVDIPRGDVDGDLGGVQSTHPCDPRVSWWEVENSPKHGVMVSFRCALKSW